MVNRARGEVALAIGGRSFRLCLTLGALAEIEAALDVDGLSALAARLADPRGADLAAILGALIRGGGHDLDDTELRALPVNLAEAASAIARALEAAAPPAP